MSKIPELVADLGAIDVNPRAVIGDNSGAAAVEMTPFDVVSKEIGDLYTEIAAYLDGAPITSDGMADDVASLKRLTQAAAQRAEKMRVAEKEPFLVGGRAIDAKFKPLSDKADLAVKTCKKVETPWLIEKQRLLDEEARLAREAATKAASEAAAAIAARDQTNLESVAEAETLIKEAKQADRAATKVENTTAKIPNMAGRATSLRTYYTPTVTDYQQFAKFVWINLPADINEFLDQLAKRLVAGGRRELPGVTITEDQRAA